MSHHDLILRRILDTPGLEKAVPRLQPELLHRVIQTCGLEDCGEIVALATPEQLARVLDLDLWRAAPGRDEQFDADRFALWLEVLLESGPDVCARTLAGMDADLVASGLARHVRVFDRAAVTAIETSDGDETIAIRGLDDTITCDVGGYVLTPRRSESLDTIAAVLTSLDGEYHDYFQELMRTCVTLSNAGYEIDGLDDLMGESEQVMFDAVLDREARRQKQGYVTPADARAFLQMSREAVLDRGVTLDRDAVPPNPIARAYFRDIDQGPPEGGPYVDAHEGGGRLQAAQESVDANAIVDILVDAGVLLPPRALLTGAQDQEAPRLSRLHGQMRSVFDRDAIVYATRNEELVYLANVLASGCSIQDRPFTPQEASDAAAAVCNLGLENWRSGSPLPDGFLVDRDLVSVFQAGWSVLHEQVGMYSAERLIQVLTQLQHRDHEIQAGLNTLRIEMKKWWRAGTPWRARGALEAIAILDMPAWAALLGLIAECPVVHAAIDAAHTKAHTIQMSSFTFVSGNDQIALVRGYLDALPDTLRG